MDYTTEIQTKLDRVRALMDEHQLSALWLRRVANVAWLTGGLDVSVNTADVFGVASLLVKPDDISLWTNTIEAPRLRAEDDIEARGIRLEVSPWEAQQAIPISGTLGTDFGFEGAFDVQVPLGRLRSRLLPAEQERFRNLSARCAEAMHDAINRVQPGSSEHEIAAALSYETRIRGVNPVVVLVAVDDRVHNVRHPLPGDKVMEHYAMLVLCGRRDGLVCSVTRLVHFGALSDDLRRRMEATAQVDAAMLAASQPGVSMEAMFQVAQESYAAAGFDGEWKLHHQGGIAGYDAREFLALPGEKITLEAGMVCAWNPSISGAKSEDSILVTETGAPPDVLTNMYGWPMMTVEVNGMAIERPLVMEIT
jgi:Xaa-Pro aminopeptidase